jgi:hypothetical protein
LVRALARLGGRSLRIALIGAVATVVVFLLDVLLLSHDPDRPEEPGGA